MKTKESRKEKNGKKRQRSKTVSSALGHALWCVAAHKTLPEARIQNRTERVAACLVVRRSAPLFRKNLYFSYFLIFGNFNQLRLLPRFLVYFRLCI